MLTTPVWLSPVMFLELYGMPLRSARLVNSGINITFRVLAGPGEFYLRLYRRLGRSRKQIDAEIAALLAFRAADEVYVAKPQRMRDGEYVFSCRYEGQMRQACLFTAARGKEASNDAGDMRQFGVALGVMHRQTASITCGRSFLPNDVIQGAWKYLSLRGTEFQQICGSIKQIGVAIEASLGRQAEFRKGFCHGDAWSGNVHFVGPRTTFFDFDDCFDGPLVADLVPQIAWLWHSNRPEFPALVRIFLDSYASVSHLSEAEVAAIPVLVQLHEISLLAFLAQYCSLEPAMWADCLARSTRMLDDWSPGGAASAYLAPLAGATRMARRWVA